MADFCGEAFTDLMTKIRSSKTEANVSDDELDRAFMRLQRLLEKKVRTYWHKAYFEKYSLNGIVPWGLRIQIFPNLRKITDSLKQSWEQNLQSCSFEMISLLCKQYELELGQLDAQINNWYDEHHLVISSPRFIKRDKDLRSHLEEYTLEIINTKEGKFLRDKTAHDNGFAYKWNHTTFNKPFSKPYTAEPSKTDVVVPNVNSVTFSPSSSTTYHKLSQERLPKKRKGDRTTMVPPLRIPGSSLKSQLPVGRTHSSKTLSSTPFPSLGKSTSTLTSSDTLVHSSLGINTPTQSNLASTTSGRRSSEPTISTLFPTSTHSIDPKLAPIFLGKTPDTTNQPPLP